MIEMEFPFQQNREVYTDSNKIKEKLEYKIQK